MTAKLNAIRTAKDIQDLEKYDAEHIYAEVREVLDIRYVYNQTGLLVEIQTQTSTGGPTVWVDYKLDSDRATVHYSHGNDSATAEAYAPLICEITWEMFAIKAKDLANGFAGCL